MRERFIRVCCWWIFLLLSSLYGSIGDGAEPEPRWSERFHTPGLNDGVESLLEFRGHLVAGGRFYLANSDSVNGVAQWDGRTWRPLGAGLRFYGSPGTVRALGRFREDLIAVGFFNSAGGNQTGVGVSRWDGSSWSALGKPVGFCQTMAVFGEDLYVAKWFTGRDGVSRFDGESWTSLGDFDNEVMHLLSEGAFLYACGGFTKVDGFTTGHIVRWDGQTWQPYAPGAFRPRVNDPSLSKMTFHEGELIVAGNFVSVDGVPAHGVARWDGTSWHAMGDQSIDIKSFHLHEGTLLATGRPPDETHRAAVFSWDGTEWNQIGNGFDNGPGFLGTCRTLIEFGGRLLCGGTFTHVDGRMTNQVAQWNGADWDAWEAPHGLGVNGVVSAIQGAEDGVYVAGDFQTAGTTLANRVARWTGFDWLPLGAGLDREVRALTVWRGKIVAGGLFERAGEVSALHVASWDGTDWSALGDGFAHAPAGVLTGVGALTVHDGQLIAGQETWGWPPTPQYIGRWDGSAWSNLGHPFNGNIAALAILDGELVAGGSFDSFSHVARWNGSSWESLRAEDYPEIFFGPVTSLAALDGKLYAAGGWGFDCWDDAGYVAEWDGLRWRRLGEIYGLVYSLGIYDGKLVAGGTIRRADGQQMPRIAKWDGEVWTPVGGGIGPEDSGDCSRVLALTAWSGNLWVGGGFPSAGSHPSANLAVWGDACLSFGDGFAGGPAGGFVYPNPVRDRAAVRYFASRAEGAIMTLHDCLGRRLSKVTLPHRSGCWETLEWAPADAAGRPLPAGAYWIRITSPSGPHSQRIAIVR